LKGTPKQSTDIVGLEGKGSGPQGYSHTDPKFWSDKAGGRLAILGDCTAIPIFEIGKQYLLFPSEPCNIRGFEEISSPNDKWLLKVRELLKSKDQ
jgi:hypothetical protein